MKKDDIDSVALVVVDMIVMMWWCELYESVIGMSWNNNKNDE